MLCLLVVYFAFIHNSGKVCSVNSVVYRVQILIVLDCKLLKCFCFKLCSNFQLFRKHLCSFLCDIIVYVIIISIFSFEDCGAISRVD